MKEKVSPTAKDAPDFSRGVARLGLFVEEMQSTQSE
jgi:hypothetical protein